jgi:uncharacterized protein (DUF58 family)
MAPPSVTGAALPREAELASFARAAAHLLTERSPRSEGMRIGTRTAGRGVQHLDYRDYAPGDEVRHIDWKQTARRRRPILRRFESELGSDWTILLDGSSSMAAHGSAKWQAARNAAAAMSYALLELGHAVGLLVFGASLRADCPRARGSRHYASIVRTLGSLRPPRAGETSNLLACAPRLHGTMSLFVLSDFLADDEMRRHLAALRSRCKALHAIQVGTDDETRLAPDGEVDLVDIETGARERALLGEAANAAAASARAAMTARLAAFCRRSGIAFSDWPVAQPWQHALIRHLSRAESTC